MRLDRSRSVLSCSSIGREGRQERYREFVEQGINYELKFIRDAVQRNQLTGGESLVLETEKRIGERIFFRSRGRPSSIAQLLEKSKRPVIPSSFALPA